MPLSQSLLECIQSQGCEGPKHIAYGSLKKELGGFNRVKRIVGWTNYTHFRQFTYSLCYLLMATGVLILFGGNDLPGLKWNNRGVFSKPSNYWLCS